MTTGKNPGRGGSPRPAFGQHARCGAHGVAPPTNMLNPAGKKYHPREFNRAPRQSLSKACWRFVNVRRLMSMIEDRGCGRQGRLSPNGDVVHAENCRKEIGRQEISEISPGAPNLPV